ncbi:MAG: aminopeptidase N [Pseudomonas sp.]|nr:aminopeptidase N [Pseudomonas sp.]
MDTVELDVAFAPHATRVKSRLSVRRRDGTPEGTPLLLDGDDLSLVGVAIDGTMLSAEAYVTAPSQLLLPTPPPGPFTLEIETRIDAEANTKLMGLYRTSGTWCTQCEAEGFRKITYYLDRPDVMSKFTTTVSAEQKAYPVLLSNGNPIASGSEDNGRHWTTWEDPFKKPAYLFALVAGDLWCVEDSFTTMSSREVALRIYVEPENIDKVQHAMDSLKRSMKWDEEVYGREYDLDIFMIVAVNDFNMGAMENKGLNIFNSSCVLAKAETATDAAHQRVEAVVAHEYFHNWSGNRVTCRDWFQLSLKEGFTVFRDSEFSADTHSRTVKRIEDVAYLRTHQFAEDAGPMAHPVRPDAYMEISNFYTLTIYEKGSEVLRMIHTLLGPELFRKGSDLYFERHDGQAVTCDDFVKAMEDASGIDLTQFKRWYTQAGTPRLEVSEAYDAAAQTYSLTFRQSCPATPGQSEKLPFVIPVALGLLDTQGIELPLRLQGESVAQGTSRVLSVTEAEQTFTFEAVAEKPLPSLLRGFSAPVKLHFPYSRDQLMFLMQHDSDGFNRWEAGQQLSVQVLQELIGQHQRGEALVLDQRLVTALRTLLEDESLDQAMVAEMLSLPGEAYLTEISEVADVEAIHAAREFARKALADALFAPLWARYQANREVSKATPYVAEAAHFARRSLQNIALSYLMLSEKPEVLAACVDQFDNADNMTERLAALAVLVNSPFQEEQGKALAMFADFFKDNPLVMDQWFSVQAGCPLPGGLERVHALMQHEAFTLKNPNKVRALIGAFANQNLINFHRADGAGYRFLADQVITLNALNPQIASRLLAPLTRWRKYGSARQALMKAELERILASGELSSDVYEVVSKSLA